MKKTILLFIAFTIIFSCKKHVTLNNDEINTKINMLHKKIREVPNDSIYLYLKQCNKLINKDNPDSIKAENDFKNGYYHYYVTKNIDTAFYFYNRATSYSKDSLKRSREFVYFINLCQNYITQESYSNALNASNDLENLLNSKVNYHELKYVNNLKQKIYTSLGDYKNSLIQNKKQIRNSLIIKDTLNALTGLLSQGNIYYYHLKNKKRAYKILDSVNSLNFLSKYSYSIKFGLYKDYGTYKYYDEKYHEAYDNYTKAIKNIKKSPHDEDLFHLADLYTYTMDVAIKLKKYKLAKKFKDSANIYKENLTNSSKMYFLEKQLELSFFDTKNFETVETQLDSIFDFLKKTELKRVNAKFLALEKATKKEKILLIDKQKIELNNQKLKTNQYILFGTSIFLLLLTFIGVLFYRQKKLQTSKNNVFMQQRLFRAQMNPHFTSNILYSIQNLNKNNTTKANSYLIKFSRLLRLILENSMQNYVAIDKEIDVLTKYLDLQQLRFPEKFEYHIKMHNLDEDSFIKIPPMLIQPFVENAIEHAFRNINYKGILSISLDLNKNFILCKIEDNGIGIKNSNKNDNATSTKLITDLLNNMTKKSIQIINKEVPKSGTIIVINIPYKESFE